MRTTINILYSSSVCSEKTLDLLNLTSKKKLIFPAQKFHRLLIEGLYANQSNVTVLSVIPVNRSTHKKLLWFNAEETVERVKYIYLPFINIPYMRQFFVVLSSFFRVLIWCLQNDRKNSIVICDLLNVAVSTTSLTIAKAFGFKTCAIVTDMPLIFLSNSANKKKHSLMGILAKKISYSLLALYQSYLLLTEQMNHLINKQQKPYIVMEGLVDIKMNKSSNTLNNKALETILIYAGGIHEQYGLKNLLKAFMLLEGKDLRLYIYGEGEMEKEMPYFENLDNRIVYKGVASNQFIVKKEMEETLLINPRFSDQEYTKYSFPSKNMEYMVSGTPLVTTPLPGMPDTYRDYVYVFNGESVEGFYTTLKSILSLPREELHDFGCRAKQFVLENKNNNVQAERLLCFFERIYSK
jgi:glycosyltransferase involved in cell wall biosynthesis